LKAQDPGGRTFKDVLHCTFFDLEIYDDFFWEIVKNGFGQVQYIRRIDPVTIDRIEVDIYGNPQKFVQNILGKQVALLPQDVIHGNKYYKGGTYGISPIIPVWEQSGLYLFAINANGDSYEFSKTPKGLLILPPVSDRFWAEFQAERKAMESGVSINRILEMRGVTNPGVAEFIKFSEDNLSLQYKDQMEMIDRNISTVYGVPDIKLGLVTAGKVANPDMQLTTFYDVVAMGHETVASKCNQQLLPLLGITRSIMAFNNPAEEDLFRMITMGKMGTESRLFTVNEWRFWMKMPPVPWGDVPLALAQTPGAPPKEPPAIGTEQSNNNPNLPDGVADPQETPA
jgi:phage portal protein BeeE